MSKIKIVIDLLKTAGIDASKYIGKVDPSKVKQLIPKNQKTATKSKLKWQELTTAKWLEKLIQILQNL